MAFDSKPAVLLVDDDQDQLRIVEKILSDLEIDIATASSGVEAYKKAKVREFAVILMDVRMPVMGGIKAVELIRYFGPYKATPIILLTSFTHDQESIQKAYQAGSIDYLYKPVNAGILLSKVSVFLEIHEQRQILLRQQAELKKFIEDLKTSTEQTQQLIAHQQTNLKGIEDFRSALIQQVNRIKQQPPESPADLTQSVDQLIATLSAQIEAFSPENPTTMDKPESVHRSFMSSTKLMEATSRNLNLLEAIDKLQVENKNLKTRLSSIINDGREQNKTG